jgi:hypothetical protein
LSGSASRSARAKTTVPTGFCSVPPPGPAMPVIATATSASDAASAPRHRPGGGDADRAERLDHVLADLELGDLGGVRIGDEAGLEHVGRAGISVSAALTSPPVQLSATATRRPGGAVGLDHLARLVDQLGGQQIVAHRLAKSIRMRRHRLGGNAFAAAGEAEPLGRRRLDADLAGEGRGSPRSANASRRDGADLRLLAMTVQSTMVDDPAARGSARRRGQEDRTNRAFPRGSDGGKCSPMSPRPAAPSKASVIAWSTTSASLCPARPRSCGISIPPIMTGPSPAKAWTSKPMPVRLTTAARRAMLLGAVPVGGVVSLSSMTDRLRPSRTFSPALDHHGRFVGRGAPGPARVGVEQRLEWKACGVWTRTRPCGRRLAEQSPRPGERVGDGSTGTAPS